MSESSPNRLAAAFIPAKRSSPHYWAWSRAELSKQASPFEFLCVRATETPLAPWTVSPSYPCTSASVLVTTEFAKVMTSFSSVFLAVSSRLFNHDRKGGA